MKNVKDKIIITAAVGFIAASTVTSMNLTPVFAKDTTNTSVVNEYSTYSEPHRPALRATHSII